MCGIAGIVQSGSDRVGKDILKDMCDCMVHRGPDDEGYYLNNNPRVSAGLGHRRLSIIDLDTGHQPIHNEKKDIYVILNGEIYNFLELRKSLEQKGHRFYTHSDAETIVHAYEEYGDDFVQHLYGMFAFALWDESRKRLILGRDRIGKKPLLYAFINGKFIFASEFKALLRHPEIEKDINPEAIHHYLTYLCIPGPSTIFCNIKKMPPSNILVFQDGKIALKEYWRLNMSKKIKIDRVDAIRELKKLLKKSVETRLISDVPLGVLLSGGVDSSCVAAFMKIANTKKIRTFSVGFGETDFNELPYAKIISDHFSTDHNEEYINPDATEILPELVERYGEPYADSSALPTYYLCRTAAKRVKVALNGDGGDEVFAGYRRHLAAYLAERFSGVAKSVNRSPLKLIFNGFPDRPSRPNSLGSIRRFLDAAEMDRAHRYMRWVGFFSEEVKRSMYTEDFNYKTKGLDSACFMERLFSEAEDLDSIDAALYVDTFFGLKNDLLVKMDIASMSNSLETRSPLLDQHLMEFMASLPSSLKINRFSLKYILKETLRDILPGKILKRPKRGFAVPVDYWFRNDLKMYLKDTLLSDRAMNRGYFKPDAMRNIISSHMSGINDYGQHLWGLLMLELWHRRFIDN